MPRRMTIQKFVTQSQAAQAAVDQVNVTVLDPAAETSDGLGEEPAQTVRVASVTEEFRYLNPKHIEPSPYQPRERARIAGPKFEELVASAKAGGVKQPIVVRPHPGIVKGILSQPWELVTGERRLLAAREAGLTAIPAIVRYLSDAEVMEEQLVENILRDDLDDVEKARGFQRMLELTDDQGRRLYTQERLADRLGISRPHLTNTLALLKLPETVQAQVAKAAHVPTEDARPMSPAHARALVPFSGYSWILDAVQARIKDEGLPPAKEFPEFVQEVMAGGHTKGTTLIRPLAKGGFLGSLTVEFSLDSKTLPRNWSQLPEYAKQHPAAPGPGPCTGCPHIRVLKAGYRYGGSREEKWCMLSACWEGKQKAHRAATKERRKKAIGDRTNLTRQGQVNRRSLKRGEYVDLVGEEPRYQHQKPLFDLTICRTKCPHKVTDLPAYREAYVVRGDKVHKAGSVCLKPAHFQELQLQAAVQKIRAWRDGKIAELKGLVKHTAKGLVGEDLAHLILMLLDGNLDCTEVSGHLDWREAQKLKCRVAMTEFFRLAFGLKDGALEVKRLAATDRRTLEGYLKFALEFHRKHTRGRR
jgi:ParB/RepB/Spo0J family partition protein